MLPLWDPNPSCPLILECSAKTFQVSLLPSFRSLLKCPLIRSLPWPHNWPLIVSSSPLPADITGHSFTLLCFSSSLVVVNPQQPALQLDTALLQTLQHINGQWFFSGWRLNRSCTGLWLMTFMKTLDARNSKQEESESTSLLHRVATACIDWVRLSLGSRSEVG